MATLTESATYDAGVYQLETTDPVAGGAAGISNSPLKNLANRTKYLKQHVDALETAASGYAPLASPSLTGSPTAPTQALGDNSTKIATDAFVQATVGGRLAKSVSGGSNVTLTAVEAGNAILEFSGVLTASIAVIVPTSPTRPWIIKNATSGAYTLTVKTAAGTGVVCTQGKTACVFTDGTNVYDSLTDFDSPVMTGDPTAPTPAQFDNDTSVATTAFVKKAGMLSSGFTAVATSSAIGLSVVGGTVLFNSIGTAIAPTLPLANTVPTGCRIEFMNVNTGVATLSRAGSDTIFVNNGVVTSFAMQQGDTLTLESDGASAWYAVGGSVQLPHSGAMAGPNWTTPPQFANDTKLATTEFVKRALGSFSDMYPYNSNQSLTVSHVGKHVYFYGGSNGVFTLPSLSGLPAGSVIFISNFQDVHTLTVQAYGAESVLRPTGVTGSITINSGESIICTVGQSSASWMVQGTGVLKYSGSFGATLAASGYQKLPSGLIIQWGTAPQSVGTTVSFPIAFPNAVLQAVATSTVSASNSMAVITALTTSQITLYNNNSGGTVRWVAFGY